LRSQAESVAQILGVVVLSVDLEAILASISALSDYELGELLKLSATGDTPMRGRLSRCLGYIQSNERQTKASRNLRLADLSAVHPQVGTWSADQSAILGRDGQLFLYKGSNDLIGMYDPAKEPYYRRTAPEWVRLVFERNQKLHDRGIKFIQVVIPEAPSIMASLFPVPIEAPSLILRLVEEALASELFFLSGFQTLSNHLGPRVFRRVDTHLSSSGAWSIFRSILRKLDYSVGTEPDFNLRTVATGDLAERFFGVPLYEELEFPDPRFTIDFEKGLNIVEQVAGPGRQIGTRHVWQNETAPIDRKVVAFGNSFFFGATSMTLGWWASRWFKEFHCIWSPDVDFEYVDAVKPDAVIAQTIERFLWRVPSN
jgi:hypothetical protein